jgi:hypothetical protein
MSAKKAAQNTCNSSLKTPQAFLSGDPGNRQQATGNRQQAIIHII